MNSDKAATLGLIGCAFALGAIILGVIAASYVLETAKPKLIRADDGTPCYTYRGSLACNFARSNRDTQFGEFPYSTP